MKIKKFLILQFCNTVLLITGSIPQIGRWYAEPVFSFFTGKSYSEEWFCNPFWTLISAWPMIFREAITPGLCFRLCLINFLLAVIVTAGLTAWIYFCSFKKAPPGWALWVWLFFAFSCLFSIPFRYNTAFPYPFLYWTTY